MRQAREESRGCLAERSWSQIPFTGFVGSDEKGGRIGFLRAERVADISGFRIDKECPPPISAGKPIKIADLVTVNPPLDGGD
jgi:hypothetical protein